MYSPEPAHPTLCRRRRTALCAAKVPIYQRAGRLVHLVTNPPALKWLRRPEGAVTIAELKAALLRSMASMAATWQRYDRRKKEWVDVAPPGDFAETLLATGAWPFPS